MLDKFMQLIVQHELLQTHRHEFNSKQNDKMKDIEFFTKCQKYYD
jgi:hypothetical protein